MSISSQFSSCASSSTSIRLAPAEKCGPSLPTTSARSFRRLPHARLQHLRRCRRRWRSSSSGTRRQHAVAQVDQAGAGVRLARWPNDRAPPAGTAGGAAGVTWPARSRLAGAPALGEQRGHAAGEQLGCGGPAASSTASIPIASSGLERTELPAESPAHDAIDVVGRVGNRGATGRCRRASAPASRAGSADAVGAVEERPGCVPRVGDRPRPRPARQLRRDCRGRYRASPDRGSRISRLAVSALTRL